MFIGKYFKDFLNPLPYFSVLFLASISLIWLSASLYVSSFRGLDADSAGMFLYAYYSRPYELFMYWWPHHPPLYFFAINLWSSLSMKETYLMLLNQLITVFSFIAIYKLGEKIGGRITAVISTAFLASNTYYFFLSTELRGYSLSILFIILSAYFFEERLLNFQKKSLCLGLVFALLAFLSEFGSLLVLVPVWISLLIRSPKNKANTFGFVLWLGFVVLIYFCKIKKNTDVLNLEYLQYSLFNPGTQDSRLLFGWKKTWESISGFYFHMYQSGISFKIAVLGVFICTLSLSLGSFSRFFSRLSFLFGPLILSALACSWRYYPGGYCRHTIYLIIPMALTLGLAVSALEVFLITFSKHLTKYHKLIYTVPTALLLLYVTYSAFFNIQLSKLYFNKKEDLLAMTQNIEMALLANRMVIVDQSTDILFKYYNLTYSHRYSLPEKTVYVINQYSFTSQAPCVGLLPNFHKFEHKSITLASFNTEVWGQKEKETQIPIKNDLWNLSRVGNAWEITLDLESSHFHNLQKWCTKKST